MILPASDRTPLIRTDFSDDAAWSRVAQAAVNLSPEGFRANLNVVDDRSFDKADPARLAQMAEEHTEHVLLILADATTMKDHEMPLLCIDPLPPGGSFRVIPEHLWGVENNVSLANMDFSEFADAVDPDGVFRGFHDSD